MYRWYRLVFAALWLSVFLGGSAGAAPPELTSLFPAGAQQGKTVEVVAGGTFARWPIQAWSDRKGVEIKPAKEKGKFSFHLAADTVPGVSWVRLHDEQGASELRPFIVGTLPEVTEKEPNNESTKPQVLAALPVVVNGRLDKAGDVDCFAVRLQKGDTLVASLVANHTLGSPMDAILQVLSADGFVLEENHDDHGLDPQIVFTSPKEGTYILRIFAFPAQPDSGIRFAGGATYIYRLTLTTGGFADHAFPLAVSRGDSATVEVIGWNIPNDAKKMSVKPDVFGLLSLWHPQLANTLSVEVEPHPCIVEAEPNDPKTPQTVSLPATISGRIDAPGDIDVFAFQGKKGQRLTFRIDAGSAGSQLDPLLLLTDAAGKRLARADDKTKGKASGRDAVLTFSVSKDGSFRLEVRDHNRQGSRRHFYRLRAAGPEPDYALTVAADRFVLMPSKPLEIPVTIARRDGFDRPIEIAVEGLPASVKVKPVHSTGAADKSATLHFEAIEAVSSAFRIVSRVAGRPDLTRTATAPRSKLPQTTSYLWLSAPAARAKAR